DRVRGPGADALDRPGLLPAPQPRPRGDAARGGADRAVLRAGRGGRDRDVRRRPARRRARRGLPAAGRLPRGAAGGRDDRGRGAGRVVPHRLRAARRGHPCDHRAHPDGDVRPGDAAAPAVGGGRARVAGGMGGM
ncbi:MAG: hypothetical protein AVDCRST_MAG66-1588, partial [uncultured Pseudonocardia sp.]